ncbi:guanylate kinase [Sedimentisphaera salicampi]|uniref:Guanylate kinase n=1 Tax=Sedimentisphaera salicampi TaxID=1941349 RepID=A0A1W6LNW7_9BACT|nr:guanylate kinase [Sedimentisphaera salicampi]ARN57441.1 Guanylate kinase [Sedimentisphaera salicampi]OXU14457.1 Guanylate kinase [Sedimentisphaera salicampi]
MSSKGKLFVVSGPSGVGKGTIVRRLDKTDAVLSVSATTRQPGKGEKDGIDYWFISRSEFEERIEKGMFLEYAEVFGNLYGTPTDKTQEAVESGKNVILEIDVQGGLQVKKKWPEAGMIFIMPPDMLELEKRIRNRARDSEETIRKRLEEAEKEIEIGKKNYQHFVVNNVLDEAVSEVQEIINSH